MNFQAEVNEIVQIIRVAKLADVLIVLLAARLNGVVVTSNLRHFERWAALAVRPDRAVAVAAAESPT